MSINKNIGAIVLAGAALTGGAQAQSTSIIQPGVQAATNNSLSLPPLTTKTNLGSDTILSGGVENSKELGAIIRGGIATRIGSDGAVYVEIAVGPNNKELFIQAGLEVTSNTMVTVSFQNLSQFQNFMFASGSTNEQVDHQAIGINTRFRVDSGLVKYVEARGYYISAPSRDLNDKEYTIDTASLFQIYNDPRRIAGSNIAGVGGVLRLGSNDNKYTLDIEGGYEQINDATILKTPTITRGTGGLKLGYHPSRDMEIYVRGGTSVGNSTTYGEVGIKSGYMNLSYSNNNGGTTQFGIRIPLNGDFSLASKQSPTPSRTKSSYLDTYNPRSSISYTEFMEANPNWTAESQKIRDNQLNTTNGTERNINNILAYVQEKNSTVPKNVHATVDRTAMPKLIVSVDTSALPSNATLDKKTGDITMSDALGFGTLISAINSTNGQSLPSDSFTLGTNTLTIHPRVLENILSTGSNILTIDTTLAITTIVVQKGSVKILSISVTRKILNTILVPGVITCSSTTITTASGTTCSITPIDPQGIATVTATFRGANVVVTKTGETYSTDSLTSTTVGIFPVIWSVTGKNPNGTNEATQTVQQNITVTMPANVPGTIATPTFESKTSTSINTAPGAVTGMSNVRVELYSNPELTNLIGTQASGDFSSLNPSTTYYAVTIGDDLNENTGATETKRSVAAIAIGTDAAPDSIPNAFSFVDQSGVALSSTITSAAVTIAGINMASPVSVTGGEYSINGGAWTSSAGSITSGQNVAVRGTSSGSNSTTTQVTLTVGGVSDIFDITTVAAAPDSIPNAFSFVDQSGVALSSTITSAAVTIAGINMASPVSVTGGEYSINGGAWTSSAGSITSGQNVAVRGTSSGSNSTTTQVTLTVGGVSDIFDITTVAAAPDSIPNAFSFVDQSGVALSSTITSAAVTIAGINMASPVSVTGGEYSINGGAWTSSAGSITSGQNVAVRGTSSGSNSTTTQVTLTVGGVSDIFDITTVAAAPDSIPNAFSFVDQSGVALSSTITSAAVTIAGINMASPVSVTGGEYSINGGAWTSSAGSITSGQNVAVRGTSSGSNSTTTQVTLTVGGVSDIFDITTVAAAPDSIPNAFSFVDQSGVALSSTITSAAVTIAGINMASPVSVTGGEYSINGGAWTSSAGSITSGQNVAVRGTSSGSNSTTTQVTLTVGGVSDIFDITTVAAAPDSIPNAFSFVDQSGVALSSTITSAAVTIAGINMASPVSVTGGEYSINGGAWTSSAGSITSGQNVAVRGTSSGSNSTTTQVTLTVGGVSDIFDITTVADPMPTGPATLSDVTMNDEDPVNINTGIGVIDPLGRVLKFIASGLPLGATIDLNTGVISGGVNVGPATPPFSITVTITPTMMI